MIEGRYTKKKKNKTQASNKKKQKYSEEVVQLCIAIYFAQTCSFHGGKCFCSGYFLCCLLYITQFRSNFIYVICCCS